ncbi:MAG TPA: TetR/AcrR family transcriptional regulator [Pseudobdellovibrionaceae bacterium]|nr:TetR/AcrR family transcriptional regulator [Pseudobdellovibrionaceae bacterium]
MTKEFDRGPASSHKKASKRDTKKPPSPRIQKKATGDYRHGDLKNVLIQAAVKLIDERNDVDFTIRELAKLTGVTHTAAYRHYRSKKDLLVAIAVIGFTKMQTYFDEAAHIAEKKKSSKVVALGEAYVNFAIENTTYFRVMFHSDLNDCQFNEELAIVGPKTFQTLVNAVSQNRQSGLYKNISEQEMSLAAWSLVHGAATLYINGMLKRDSHPTPNEMRQWAHSICLILETGLVKR